MKVSIDSRTIKKGEYFVPIKGPNFDGKKFIKNALSKGAKGIIEEDEFYQIAKNKLDKIKPLTIGIAGSIGKSTFRSYLASILKTRFSILEGDQNTKVGLALKIINELNTQKIFIAEIGIDRLGEMEKTSKFINPDFAVITKLGKEHLEYLKSLTNVAKENIVIIKNSKLKLSYLNKKDKTIYDKFLSKNLETIYFPKPKISKVVLNSIYGLTIPDHEKDYLIAIYQIVSDRFSFSTKDFIRVLPNLHKPKGRLNLLKGKNGSIVIDDTYNAVCDQTIIEGIKFASKVAEKENKKLHLIISNMRENGNSKRIQHKNVAEFINNSDYFDLTVFGDETELYKKYIKRLCITHKDVDQIKIEPHSDDLFYIKSANYYKGHMLVELLVNGI